jgi:hypothetical protein
MKNIFKISIFAFLLHALMLLSCGNEEFTGVEIPFIKIIGSYDGKSKLCSLNSLNIDSLCAPETINKATVTLFDNTNIVFEDDAKIFNKLILTYQKTLNNSGQPTQFFNSNTIQEVNLTYNEITQLLTLKYKSGSKGQYFTGNKK